MKFELAPSNAAPDAQDIARAILSRHPAASIEVEPASGIVRVSGRISAQEASAAFARAGIAVRQLEDGDSHVSGGSTCCGGCA